MEHRALFTGTWEVVSSPDFDDDYLSMEVPPFVRLRQEGAKIVGDYHVGVQTGNLDAGWKAPTEWCSASRGWTNWTR